MLEEVSNEETDLFKTAYDVVMRNVGLSAILRCCVFSKYFKSDLRESNLRPLQTRALS